MTIYIYIYTNDIYPKAKKRMGEFEKKQMCLYFIVKSCHFLFFYANYQKTLSIIQI